MKRKDNRRERGGTTQSTTTILIWQQLQAGDVPREMMHGAAGRQDNRTAGREGEAHQALSRGFQTGFGVGRELDDASRAAERRGYVEIAARVEGKALRAAQTLI